MNNNKNSKSSEVRVQNWGRLWKRNVWRECFANSAWLGSEKKDKKAFAQNKPSSVQCLHEVVFRKEYVCCELCLLHFWQSIHFHHRLYFYQMHLVCLSCEQPMPWNEQQEIPCGPSFCPLDQFKGNPIHLLNFLLALGCSGMSQHFIIIPDSVQNSKSLFPDKIWWRAWQLSTNRSIRSRRRKKIHWSITYHGCLDKDADLKMLISDTIETFLIFCRLPQLSML